MLIERTIDVLAPPDRVMAAYLDVEHWPAWTPTVTAVEKLDGGPLRAGSRVRLEQPRLRPAVWEVTSLEPGRSFAWVSRMPGVRTTATHTVLPSGNGSAVTATLEQRGGLAWLVSLLSRSLTVKYVETELEGIKGFCEL